MEKDKKEIVGPGKFVTYSYKLFNDADGALLFEAPKDAPDMLVFGVSQEIVPGLLTALEGLTAGDRFEVTLPPVAAFGERLDDNVVELDKEIFMRDGKLADEVMVGAMLPMMTAEGFRIQGRVLEVGDKIKMDFNHPFAGLTVRFEGEVEEVRDATPDELKPAHGCGCSGCGSHDGGCGEEGGCGGHDGEGGCCGGCK